MPNEPKQAQQSAKISLTALAKKAKKYKRSYNLEHPEAPITLQQAQDIVARQYRFKNYHHATQVLGNALPRQQAPNLATRTDARLTDDRDTSDSIQARRAPASLPVLVRFRSADSSGYDILAYAPVGMPLAQATAIAETALDERYDQGDDVTPEDAIIDNLIEHGFKVLGWGDNPSPLFVDLDECYDG